MSSPASTRTSTTANDLAVAGLGTPGVRLWAVRDASGSVVGTTGFETSADGRHALLRSVAVSPALRGSGTGSRLAAVAMGQAASAGAARAWLFSRRSGPFWQGLGFAPADPGELAAVLAGTTQVALFRRTGQLAREVAWSRPL
ncbi:N-acetylglutamate synthase-like GNAT family acetyltransferase [Curtobacterium luteum]|uniref:N-acetylglutamate synthase-like GNAT family acetyltransferase n=1 Tax=Curtobacterium luteum TaxID=33881 RepID=A0ABS2RVW2_9MICO|nr:GNAT family N-acetyltransferase [Curtobacterium luteum]MBM7803160.1 N-acetylglutamate synthase-like GNAT family acetyltransferase [Curtobacterium luteum]